MAHLAHALNPEGLPGEPIYYLSAAQREVCERKPSLAPYAALLPCWIPHADVAAALGHERHAIDAAFARVGAYAWATEFENVHATWRFDEPGFEFGGIRWNGSEQLYQAQKAGAPGSAEFQVIAPAFAEADPMEAYELGRRLRLRADWEAAKDDAMRTALRAKFLEPGPTGDSLRALLLSTHPRPLASVKGDAYWGIGLAGDGDNKLAAFLMELRDELRRGRDAEA